MSFQKGVRRDAARPLREGDTIDLDGRWRKSVFRSLGAMAACMTARTTSP